MPWFPGRLTALACAVGFSGTVAVAAGPASKETRPAKVVKQASAFGKFEGTPEREARQNAEDWLREAGKSGPEVDAAFAAIWAKDRPVLERLANTFALGDVEAARLLAEARGTGPAPTAVPALLKDARKPAFFRANLALAYGRALTERKVYEEGLEALALVNPEDVVDPSAYFFSKAVCEHAMMMKDDAARTIDRLLGDVTDAAERHREVAALMRYDMETWAEKDLGWIARKMDNIQRRLDLNRGGEKTRQQQREVLDALAKLIKDLEDPGDGPRTPKPPGPDGDGPTVPGPRSGQGRPAPDSTPGGVSGIGQVDLRRFAAGTQWGKLPPKERAQIMAELTRGLPPKDRAVIETYVRSLARRGAR